jgi:hypothetical protein
MKTIELQDWHTLKKQLKDRFPSLTERDLVLDDRSEDELFGRLQVSLGLTKNEILSALREVKPITF